MSLPSALSYAVEVVDTSGLSEEAWLEYRRQGIGGSDVAAVMGVSPFVTLRDLYNDKCGNTDVIQAEDNWVAKEVGHRLEDLVAKIFAFKTGKDKQERDLALSFGLAYLDTCDRLVICGSRFTKGMLGEIQHAAAQKIPIFWISEDYSPCRSIGKIEYEEIQGW